jgi:hypothetical protein
VPLADDFLAQHAAPSEALHEQLPLRCVVLIDHAQQPFAHVGGVLKVLRDLVCERRKAADCPAQRLCRNGAPAIAIALQAVDACDKGVGKAGPQRLPIGRHRSLRDAEDLEGGHGPRRVGGGNILEWLFGRRCEAGPGKHPLHVVEHHRAIRIGRQAVHHDDHR